MCGISGIANFRGSGIDVATLERMIHQILHRGPDETGTYSDNYAGLAHARLSIIDLAGGQQPMANHDKSLWITFNGEIFNYLELRHTLTRRGHRFSTQSDTEVILHLYEDKGEDCVADFNGQWAFAIWDAKAKRLFLSRDRLGVRPLFYTTADGAFLFASEIKSLFAVPGVARELDPIALDQTFTFLNILAPRTAFKQIRELPPGHSLTLDSASLTVRPHWRLNFIPAAELSPQRPRREAEYAKELLDLLTDATRLRLRSDVPVGAYLSGGLDSTIITALIRSVTSGPLTTFSVAFEDQAFDETAYQRRAAAFLGTTHHELRCSYRDIGATFPDVIWHAERPLLWTAPGPLYLLSRAVRNHGFKVVLTGEGSDELFGGYDIFKEAKIRRFCAAQPESRRRPLLLRRAYPYLDTSTATSPSDLRRRFHVDSWPLCHPLYSHLPRWHLLDDAKRLLFSRGLVSEIRGHDQYAELLASTHPALSHWHWLSRAQYLEVMHNLSGYLLSSQGDRVAMAHAVEGRFPFLDHRLVTFATNLPPGLKLRALREKHLLRNATAHLIPAEVAQRRKQPYRAPLGRSFFGSDSSMMPINYVRELLSRDRLSRDGLFDPLAVAQLLDKFRSGDPVTLADNWALGAVVSTQLLVDQFINGFGRRWPSDAL